MYEYSDEKSTTGHLSCKRAHVEV